MEFFYALLILIPVAAFFTNHIGNFEFTSQIGAIISTLFALTTLASSILLFGISSESWIRFHFRACLAWAYLASLVTFVNLLHLTQCASKYYSGQMTLLHFAKIMAKSSIHFTTVLLMTYYVPRIHPNFDFGTIFGFDEMGSLINKENLPTLRLIWNAWMDHYKVFCPGLIHSNFESSSQIKF